jgi:hydrogenase expression/formation protein HypD
MHLADDFRDPQLAERLLATLARQLMPGRTYRLMEFCGGHTHALCHSGLLDRLPEAVRMIHGPGCPVCVLPIGRLQQAIDLATERQVILCSYGDMLRVPGRGRQSLLHARSAGADVRMVYGPADALVVARQHPQRQVVFLAVGFETTTPMTAAIVCQARAEGLCNFSILCNHVLTPAALRGLLATTEEQVHVDGFVGPGHVSTIIGTDAFASSAQQYGKPIVIAGFEPIDLLSAILHLVEQLNAGRAEVQNDFVRAVSPSGNQRAQALISQVLELRESFEWRGLGSIAHSALRLRPEYSDFDAEQRFSLSTPQIADHRACRCPEVLRGTCRPTDCTLFGTACTPDSPLGSCMVSPEGACAAYFHSGRSRLQVLPNAPASPPTA